MTQKALKVCLKTATESYKEAISSIERGYLKRQQIYDVYFAAIYAIDGIVYELLTTDEKVIYSNMVDKQHKEIRKLLKM